MVDTVDIVYMVDIVDIVDIVREVWFWTGLVLDRFGIDTLVG